MNRPPFVVPPGRNATLNHAWEALYGKPKKAAEAAPAKADANIPKGAVSKKAKAKPAKNGARK